MDDAEETEVAHADRVELMPSLRCHVGGRDLRFSEGLCRLIVAVALERDGLGRRALQTRLWPDLEPPDAAKRLRQSLWRLRRETGERLLDVTGKRVRLADTVTVDLRMAERKAREAITGDGEGSPPDRADWSFLGTALLTGWSDEEVNAERERWNRLRLLALERLAEHGLRAGDVLGALEFAGLAVGVDMFCEAPHRLMSAAHLARGDQASAWRVYEQYRRLLVIELGLEPSAEFRELIGYRHVGTRCESSLWDGPTSPPMKVPIGRSTLAS